ncbi:hypothetical protein TNCV_2237661 [Trichonephila clavipes]|nr:hypothetical protein TNCV_2237661 [Trichonephila clavipes]
MYCQAIDFRTEERRGGLISIEMGCITWRGAAEERHGRGHARAIGDGPRKLEPWSRDEDDTYTCTLLPELLEWPW